MKVKELMTKNVTSTKMHSTISEVANNMKNLNVGAIPVCDTNNQLMGIITDRDIVLRSVAEGGRYNQKAKDVMSSQIVSVTSDTHIHEAARIMSENQIRRLPVVDNGKLVGMISIGDLATQNIYTNEAGDTLSNVSRPSRPMQ